MRFVFVGLLVSIQVVSYGQNVEDAVRFSTPEIMGTARFVSMAGAFGALGGEASGVMTNPAGIGVFRSGQFSSSITVGQKQANTSHYGSESSAQNGFGRLSNFSVVLSEKSAHPDWEFLNVYFAYNQQSIFKSKTNFEGVNNQSSLLDLYLLDIIEDPDVTVESVYSFFPFGAGNAFESFLIDTLNGEYYHGNEFHGQTQGRKDVQERGIGHYSLGLGGNYRDKLYLGGTIGFSSLRFKNISTYYEEMQPNDPNTFVTDWKEVSNLQIKGNGIQLKLGAIYRINKYLRAGASFRSSEYFRLSEVYTTRIDANWEDRAPTDSESPEGLNDYKMRSPYSLGLSFGAAKKKLGAINIDIDYVDYRVVEFSTIPLQGIDFSTLNNEIQSVFKPTVNVRMGVEKTIGPYAVRGGYGYQQGIANTTAVDRQQIGFGLGYRRDVYVFDVGYNYSFSSTGERFIHFAENINLEASTFQNIQQQFVASFAVYFNE